MCTRETENVLVCVCLRKRECKREGTSLCVCVGESVCESEEHGL